MDSAADGADFDGSGVHGDDYHDESSGNQWVISEFIT
jgi:hypothetical protein